MADDEANHQSQYYFDPIKSRSSSTSLAVGGGQKDDIMTNNPMYDFNPLSATTELSEIYSKNFFVSVNSPTTIYDNTYNNKSTSSICKQTTSPSATTGTAGFKPTTSIMAHSSVASNYENNFIQTIVLNNCNSMSSSNPSTTSSSSDKSTVNHAADMYDEDEENACELFYDEEDDGENLCCQASLPPEVEISIYGSETLPENSVLEAENNLVAVNTIEREFSKKGAFVVSTSTTNETSSQRGCAGNVANNVIYSDTDFNNDYALNSFNYNNNFTIIESETIKKRDVESILGYFIKQNVFINFE